MTRTTAKPRKPRVRDVLPPPVPEVSPNAPRPPSKRQQEEKRLAEERLRRIIEAAYT